MKKLICLALCMILCCSAIFAQSEEAFADDLLADSETVYKQNQKGDQNVQFNIAMVIPAAPKNLKLGGSGTIGYSMFLSDNLALGGEVNFSYCGTIAGNVFYFVPVLLKPTWQFEFGKFEVPVSFGLGVAFENYTDRFYFGIAAKPSVGFFYRFSQEWSFGATAGVFLLPQFYSNPDYNYLGVIPDIQAAIRCHF
ncbi:MAG: hypothetical protein MJ183_09645 [Treponemataceae bacterium]|nr:hypothetical protein [Treponemataceae bacterium]